MFVEDLRSSRLFWQVVVSAAIFVVVVGVSRLPLLTADLVVRGVRYAVTDEYDFVEVTKRFPSVDEVRTNYLQKIVDWLKSTRPEKPQQVRETPIWPVEGQVIASYGWRLDPATKQERLHEGIDIQASEGTPIRAVLSGVVASVRESPTYGKVMEIDHGGGISTLYAHCQEIVVPASAKVKQGDVIAKVGKTGNATAPHLHLEVIENGRPIDPLRKLLEGGA
ncbi:MAG: M23 family metallopeptidase [Bacillota bacterium]|nr:M23 family metallopeptidase [Bacillota bacterium]